ncbi:hypothetical protein T459_02149 [Capsicum annuum]|uniref:Uncharacterized protein n=1 Tax=Capsicum annuum TaxID=4072 RepID=A0A2G3AJ45_CAPAN|nr:hypothetical protein T459_02149 [Capsicum annuum]
MTELTVSDSLDFLNNYLSSFTEIGIETVRDDEFPAKTSKVDTPSSQYLGGAIPGYPPRPTFGAVPPLYVPMEILLILLSFEFPHA